MESIRFDLLDDGILQKIDLVKTSDLPISLVILIQTGGSAALRLSDYADLSGLLGKMLGSAEYETTLVTFDSKIEQIWHFPKRRDGVDYALMHLKPGDQGAAILDAVHFGVFQLQGEAGRFRRIVLLLSQDTDEGSTISPHDLLEQIGTSSTVVHSIAFRASKSSKSRKISSKRSEVGRQSFDAQESALNMLHQETAMEISALTGGEFRQFTDQSTFNLRFLEIANETKDSYTLGFQPNRRKEGFHRLKVELPGRKSGITLHTRGAYWFRP